jgi:hypothetical protein
MSRKINLAEVSGFISGQLSPLKRDLDSIHKKLDALGGNPTPPGAAPGLTALFIRQARFREAD